MKPVLKIILCLSIIVISSLISAQPFSTSAETADELRLRIQSRNQEIEALQKEIESYQRQIDATGRETKTLKSAISALDLTRKKLTASIILTEKRIDATTLAINSLSRQIGDKEGHIKIQELALSETLRRLEETDQTSLVEALLTYKTLGDFWNGQLAIIELQGGIHERMTELVALRDDLKENKRLTEVKKKELLGYKQDLADQKIIVEANRRDKDNLLAETKSKESNYKKLLAGREIKRNAFAKEILDLESQLRLITDPSNIPAGGRGVLNYPLDNPFVTQAFGDTSFSRSNPQVYSGLGHNGVDFRASIGTPIKAALNGVVKGIGDTDSVCPGASYGKWVMIEHSNGLSTLYAHLSLIRVSEGQSVSTGNTIGYSGSTGYATGPHLHFTVYATKGVEIISRRSRICGGTYRIPIADLRAYLNPLSYL